MRYHYEKPTMYRNMYGETYECNYPVYNKCTLFKMGQKGLAVIQQMMWGMKMKPIPRERWGDLLRSEGYLVL